MKPIISPSILSADFGYLARDIEMINESEAEWVHIDIMDGVFVPNISFGFPVLKYVAKLSQKPLDVHLMIVQHGEVYSGGEGSGSPCHECALRGLSASAPRGAANSRSRDAAGSND